MASAELHGLGDNASAPITFNWSHLPLRASPRILPWLGLLSLCLLKSNRRVRAWLVWLPMLVVWGLALRFQEWSGLREEPVRLFLQLFPTALAFGWAATLLLVTPGAPPTLSSRYTCLLLGFGVLPLLSLAVGYDWSREWLTDIVCGVTFQFTVIGLLAALRLAGHCVRRGFAVGRLLGWFVLWLVLIWILLLIPAATLSLAGNRGTLGGVAAAAGLGCLISLLVSLPFFGLASVTPFYRLRVQELLLPMAPVNDEKRGNGLMAEHSGARRPLN